MPVSRTSIVPYLRDLYPDTVTYRSPISYDDRGNVTAWSSSVSIPARVLGQIRNVRDVGGQIRVSSVQAHLAGYFGVRVDGEFTLPARVQPNQPSAISVEVAEDESGPHHETVYF